jgi:hypothetical protein
MTRSPAHPSAVVWSQCSPVSAHTIRARTDTGGSSTCSGRVAGVFIAILIPFLDMGIGQSPMLRSEPAAWATYLFGYGGTRLFIDGRTTASFDETRALLIAVGWLAGTVDLTVFPALTR